MELQAIDGKDVARGTGYLNSHLQTLKGLVGEVNGQVIKKTFPKLIQAS